jgi:prepilin-type N-terminal cleavage/methylation domain-containing protein
MKKSVSALKTLLRNKKAFTIIELLVVIGIIGILAVALLVTLNPTEAQRKARDSKRLKDAATLQAIIEQNLNDGGDFNTCTPANTCKSSTAGSAESQPCSNNWLGENLCLYAQTIPTDPANNQSRTVIVNVTQNNNTYTPTTGTDTAEYFVGVSNADYEIMVMMESTSNAQKILNDGGNSAKFVEIGSNLNLITETGL